uniref:GRAM domain containing 1C n=1 Tax=Rousettus aegyptiacus TaxID=9407 RepID=A0A7J8HPM9_ROUAE|nr:GRAM domain containing 1C [Rousettus aegyptiacus]
MNIFLWTKAALQILLMKKIFLRKIFMEDFISTVFSTLVLRKCLNCSSPVHALCRDLPVLEI